VSAPRRWPLVAPDAPLQDRAALSVAIASALARLASHGHEPGAVAQALLAALEHEERER
jgi:hypothetical protein